MRVFFATPLSGRLVALEYAVSLAAATAHLAQRGIETECCIQEGYDVSGQRDMLAHRFLQSKATHLQFVDSDIGFPADLTETLLGFNEPLIGALCPTREFSYRALEALIKRGEPAESALDLSHHFAFLGEAKPDNRGLASVQAIGAGYLLIAREVFEKLAPSLPKYRIQRHSETMTQFFACGVTPDGERVPEDWSFCARWRQAGGKVLAYVHSDIEHVSAYRHKGNMGRFLAHKHG